MTHGIVFAAIHRYLTVFTLATKQAMKWNQRPAGKIYTFAIVAAASSNRNHFKLLDENLITIKMSKKLFNVISPDGFPISCEPFASEREALSAIPGWCERFKNQGYYSTSNRQKIPLKELPDYLHIVTGDLIGI